MINYFGIAVIVLFLGAFVYSAVQSQWNEAFYSLSAALVNVAVYLPPFK